MNKADNGRHSDVPTLTCSNEDQRSMTPLKEHLHDATGPQQAVEAAKDQESGAECRNEYRNIVNRGPGRETLTIVRNPSANHANLIPL